MRRLCTCGRLSGSNPACDPRLAGTSRPLASAECVRPLPSCLGASLRRLGRRQAHTARVLAIDALAVAFGTAVLSFTATYQTAKEADARASTGSDLNLTPGDRRFTLPQLDPEIAAVSRDLVPLTVFPDDYENASDLELRVLGVSGHSRRCPRMPRSSRLPPRSRGSPRLRLCVPHLRHEPVRSGRALLFFGIQGGDDRRSELDRAVPPALDLGPIARERSRP